MRIPFSWLLLTPGLFRCPLSPAITAEEFCLALISLNMFPAGGGGPRGSTLNPSLTLSLTRYFCSSSARRRRALSMFFKTSSFFLLSLWSSSSKKAKWLWSCEGAAGVTVAAGGGIGAGLITFPLPPPPPLTPPPRRTSLGTRSPRSLPPPLGYDTGLEDS